MGGTEFSRVKFNAREIALSSDQVRGETLFGRELQNVLGFGSAQGDGTMFSCLLRPMSLAAVVATFTMNLADGDAFFYFPTDVSLTVDDSPFEVLRWRSVTPLVFGTPDGTNPRIDLVVATPASADVDLTSRNILLDPIARTIAAQNIFKTTNPNATISVVAGTPGATPAPPAVPAGKVALFEVFVPAAVADSASFVTVPRLFRRAGFPWSAMSGIITGFGMQWDLSADPASTSANLQLASGKHKVLIDGELLELGTAVGVSQDSSNSPFSVAAGGTDKPYFIYAVGGRHAPQGVFGGGPGFGCPVAIVESLTAPDLGNYGRPTSAITTPRGTTTIDGAVYCGLGWVVAGTTRRRACIMDDELTHIVGGDIGYSVNYTTTGAVALPAIADRPSISRRMVATAFLSGGGVAAGDQARVVPDRGDGAGAAPGAVLAGRLSLLQVVAQVAALSYFSTGMVSFNPLNATLWVQFNVSGTGAIGVQPKAYEHRVARIAAG